jgi:hypothetical protein
MGELACKQKIIMDGGNAARLFESLCETIQTLTDEQTARLTDDVAYPIINLINQSEDAAIKAQRLFLKNVVQYDGPLPKMLGG